MPFPSPSSSGDQVLAEHALPRWAVHPITSPIPPPRFPGCKQKCRLTYAVWSSGSWPLAVTLLAYVNRPGSQEDLVSNWEPARSLVEDPSPGAEIAPRLPALAVTRPPLCLQLARDGPAHSRLALLWYSISPLFCEQACQCLRLELFTGKFSLSLLLFFPLSLLSHSLGFYLVSSLRLPLGYSSPFLILSNAAYASLFRPRLLVAVASIWATSPLKAANRCIICGVFFSLPVMLPSENQKFPTDPPVRRFPGIWKLLLFHDSLPGTGLHP